MRDNKPVSFSAGSFSLATRDCSNKIVILELPELTAERQEDNKGGWNLKKLRQRSLWKLQDICNT
jgi:hypothetical protein